MSRVLRLFYETHSFSELFASAEIYLSNILGGDGSISVSRGVFVVLAEIQSPISISAIGHLTTTHFTTAVFKNKSVLIPRQEFGDDFLKGTALPTWSGRIRTKQFQ